MNLPALDYYYLNQQEPTKGSLLALSDFILRLDTDIAPAWKWRMPVFTYQGKYFCYLWTDKKTDHPYIGFVEGNRLHHPLLEMGDRTRIKVLRIDPNEDLPIELIRSIFEEALDLY